MKILYVEDNPQDSDLARRELTKSAPNIHLDVSSSLAEARERLAETADYDLVLLDLRLPDGSGLDLLAEIRDREMAVAVVILTGSGDEETAVAALKAGADDYVVKQADYLNRLPGVLETAVSRSRRAAARRMRPLRILYVEHNSVDIDLTQRHMARHAPHIRLEPLSNTEQALQRLPQTPDAPCPCDVLLLDYRLPGLNALELLKIIREERQLDVPVVLVTGQGNEEVAAAALRLGATDYVVKHGRYLYELPAVLENAHHQTQLVHEQAALQESEARFRRLAENAPDIIFRVLFDPEVQIDYISPAVTSLTGYTPEDFYTDPNFVSQIIHEEDLAKLTALTTELKTNDESLITIRLTHKNGRLVWLEINPVLVRDVTRKVIALEGVARDMTAAKEAAETLRLQSAALNAAANAIIIIDHELNIQWANPAFTTLTGYTIEEAVGRKPSDILNSELHDEAFFENLESTIISGKVWQGEIVNRRQDGTLYTEWTTITPVIDAEGRINQFIEIKQDISQRKVAEADRDRLMLQVREQAQRVQQIIETVPEGVLLLDGDGRVVLANPVAETDLSFLTQLEDEEMITALGDQPLADLLADPPEGFWHEIEYNGRTFEVIARSVGSSGQPEHWVMVINEVTEARAYLRYQQAQERLATVGQLAAGIAHDFNNVMAVIILYAQLLQGMPNLTPKNQKHLAMIVGQAEHAAKLIQQILDFSRRSVLEMTTLDLLPVVKELIKLLERTMPENISLSLDYDENEYLVQADPTRLQQALMNLAVNARDAMPEGGQFSIQLSTLNLAPDQYPPLPDMAAGQWVQLVVSDTGMGVSAKAISRLFEPFFSTKAPGRGTGLGLAQVHGIVKQHGGSIDVQSEEGAGTVFTLFLPLLTLLEVDVPSSTDEVALVGGSETILLVEDNQPMLASVGETLKTLGYQVLTATNGVEALTLLAEEGTAVSLVLSDLIMPEMGGLELYQTIREKYPLIKILVMTGHPLGESVEDLAESGIVSWFQKPFTNATLAKKVRETLESGL